MRRSRNDHATAPLFADAVAGVTPRPVAHRAMYSPCNPAMRTARDFCNALVTATDPARRAECYRLMIAAMVAKDGV
jgi:hypothetical protein